MVSVIADMFARYVELHPFTRDNARLNRAATSIGAELAAFYLQVGVIALAEAAKSLRPVPIRQ